MYSKVYVAHKFMPHKPYMFSGIIHYLYPLISKDGYTRLRVLFKGEIKNIKNQFLDKTNTVFFVEIRVRCNE